MSRHGLETGSVKNQVSGFGSLHWCAGLCSGIGCCKRRFVWLVEPDFDEQVLSWHLERQSNGSRVDLENNVRSVWSLCWHAVCRCAFKSLVLLSMNIA